MPAGIETPPADVPWRVPDNAPPDSVAEATLAGGEDQDGAYLVLMKWVAGTPHDDGARAEATEPAIIAVSGIGPVHQQWVDPSQPVLRHM